MSGIAGIFNLDGAPVDPAILKRMTDAIAHRGPDGIHHVIDGNVGLGHCMLATTPEALHETQPLWDETRTYCLTMDGRVDNREDLTRDLKSAGAILRDDTDAELVLKTYITWRDSAPSRIIGDFAFVVWDSTVPRIFCSRDCVGVRPFYFFADTRVFLCGSELAQILAHPAVARRPDEGYVAEHLAFALSSTTDTAYKDVKRLSPGHSLHVCAAGLKQRCYWSPGELTQEPRQTCPEAFRALLEEAVRCRLRANGPVGVELSGGVDSTSVAAIAASIAQSNAADLLLLSSLYIEPVADERFYIHTAREAIGLPWCGIEADVRRKSCSAALMLWPDIPPLPNGGGDALKGELNRRGGRVLLTGMGGDEWLAGSEPRPPRLWHHHRLPRVMARAGSLLFHAPTRVRRRLGYVAPWIRPSFARRIRLADRLTCRGFTVHAFELEEKISSRWAVEQRHAFHDRRVIEYALSLPPSELWSGGLSKVHLRRALQDILPATIAARSDKADFSFVAAEALQAERAAEMFSQMAIGEFGWVVTSTLRQMFRDMVHAYNQGERALLPSVCPLWTSFAVESWFRYAFV